MSNAIYPSITGLSYEYVKIPEFKKKIVEGQSGKVSRIALWSTPRWHFKLKYNHLINSGTYTRYQELASFFMKRYGSYDDFLFDDHSDNTVTGQAIGTGDGTTTTFTLVRAFNGFAEKIGGLKALSHVYLGGVETTAFTAPSVGDQTITFTTAPGDGVAITADFTFYYRVYFDMDMPEFSEFLHEIWKIDEVDLVSVK